MTGSAANAAVADTEHRIAVIKYLMQSALIVLKISLTFLWSRGGETSIANA
jgi:uncharacterized protein YgbK (DUF1537 family)